MPVRPKPTCNSTGFNPGSWKTRLQSITCRAAVATLVCLASADAEGRGKTEPGWKIGVQGNWQAAENWADNVVPAPVSNVEILGAAKAQSRVTFDGAKGDVLLANLYLGGHWPNAALAVTGGSLTVTGQFEVGSQNRGTKLPCLYAQTGGTVYANYVAIGSFNVGRGADRNCVAEATFEGGAFLCRELKLGVGGNSFSTLRVIGSATSSLVILDKFTIGPVKMSKADGKPLGSRSVIQFVLDSTGVTPIVLRSPTGFNIRLPSPASLVHCELSVSLKALPPAEDIVLLQALLRSDGTFDGLAEGSAVTARDPASGRTFEWTLRYDDTRRGAHDIALTAIREVVDGKKTAYAGDGVHHARGTGVEPARIEKTIARVYQSVNGCLPPLRTDADGPLAFPDAEGFGARAQGGRGGKVLFVTNLNDSGPGSLRDACENQSGRRTVIFRVGGQIALKQRVSIHNPYITIAGQTAHGDGICITGHGLELNDTHDVIIRYLRIRPGAKVGHIPCVGINIIGSHDVIADHCSVSWANWDGTYVSVGSDRYTIQNCIFAEGLASLQSFAAVIGSGRGSFHHNLLAHNLSRNPHFAKLCQCDWRNNLIYDWGARCGYGDFQVISYVNNYLKPGPSTTQKRLLFIDDHFSALPRSIYLAGNIIEGHFGVQADNWRGVAWPPEAALEKDFTVTDPACANYVKVTTQPAETAYKLVLATAGATVPMRDSVDRRIVDAVVNRTGKIIEREQEVAALPNYQSGKAPADSDNDGIPDDWEKLHGLNPNDSADGSASLEKYLDGIVAQPRE